MPTVNLGILAHVDAGKTTLTERLLLAAGVIDQLGSVDDGNTQTDTLTLERRRGITIKSAVVSFAVDGVTVNLIDTPGHPDFIAEVERALGVLDGAALVVSAVEGVQPQTRVLMRALQRLRIPTLLFVNKIDRKGADDARVLHSISERLTRSIVAMGVPSDSGCANARVRLPGPGDTAFASRLLETLAEHDDALLSAFAHNEKVAYARLRAELATQVRRAQVHPVFFGSAITGAGVDGLLGGIAGLLPCGDGDTDGPMSGTVFKVERGPAREKIAYVRMFSGTLRAPERIRLGDGRNAKVTRLAAFEQGTASPSGSLKAGQIGKLWGLGRVQIGDTVGIPRQRVQRHRQFPPPTLETVVQPQCASDRGALHAALRELAEQDPLINLRHDGQLSVSLYGEVQKEVIRATLAEDFGIEVVCHETTTIYIERPAGAGEALEVGETPSNPFLATVGLRVQPAPAGSGITFRIAVELGSMPFAFFRAVEETVRESLRQGLHGWEVTDCAVTMTHAGYWPRQSHAHARFDKSMSSTGADFRNVTPLVLMDALRRAGTTVQEPIHRFHLELPAEALRVVLPALTRLRAVPASPHVHGAECTLYGDIPAARVHDLQQQVPALTSGEGILESSFDRYQPVRGRAPARARTDRNPLNREEYLLHTSRRM